MPQMGVYNYTPWQIVLNSNWLKGNAMRRKEKKKLSLDSWHYARSIALGCGFHCKGKAHFIAGSYWIRKGIIRSDGVVYTQDRAPLLSSVFLFAHVIGCHNLFDMHSNLRHKLHFSRHTTFFCAWQATSRQKCTCQLNLKINYDIFYLKRLQVC